MQCPLFSYTGSWIKSKDNCLTPNIWHSTHQNNVGNNLYFWYTIFRIINNQNMAININICQKCQILIYLKNVLGNGAFSHCEQILLPYNVFKDHLLNSKLSDHSCNFLYVFIQEAEESQRKTASHLTFGAQHTRTM